MTFKFDDLPKIYLERKKYPISLVKDLDVSRATVFSEVFFSVILNFINLLDVLSFLCRFLTVCNNIPYARWLKDGACSDMITLFHVI